MLLFPVPRFHVDKLVHLGAWVFSSIAGVILVLMLVFLTWPTAHRKKAPTDRPLSSLISFYPLESIGSGALALHPKMVYGWVSRLAEEFSIVAYNSRPDAPSKEAPIIIAVNGGQDQSTITNGSVVFFQEKKEGKGLVFSDGSGIFWAKPILLDNGTVLIEAGRKLISKEGELVGEEKAEYITTARGVGGVRSPPYLQELKAVRCLGQDLLIHKYGGREYAAWREKIKIEFSTGSRSYACFVSSGDKLQYSDGEWRVVSQECLDPHLPVAHLRSATVNGCEIEGWDELGLYPICVKTEVERCPAPSAETEHLPASLRIRSATQVSCLLGKKRVILRQGDWLLRTSHGWRNLKRTEEIESCLYHKIKGELFIFDSIEKQMGQSFMKGQLFNVARTGMTSITLPIENEQKVTKKGKKKKYLSGRREGV